MVRLHVILTTVDLFELTLLSNSSVMAYPVLSGKIMINVHQ